MNGEQNLENRKCLKYLDRSVDEEVAGVLLGRLQSPSPSLVIAEGFEERSIGLLRTMAARKIRVPFMALLRYEETADLNVEFRAEFERLAEQVAPGNWRIFENNNDRRWVDEAITSIPSEDVIIDISGLTTRGTFAALDALNSSGKQLLIGYTEAREYRPTRDEWASLLQSVEGDMDEDSLVAERVDEAEWLYSGAHTVQLIDGHEGYDSAGVNALVAFLPFKPVRLGSLIGHQQYSAHVYVAGSPRLAENSWRLHALKRMNATIVRQGRVVKMDTFGYRRAFASLTEIVCGPEGLLNDFDVHLAPMGSKLQNLAAWALSSLVPAITIVTSVPDIWYPKAFSHGLGESWLFPLTAP